MRAWPVSRPPWFASPGGVARIRPIVVRIHGGRGSYPRRKPAGSWVWLVSISRGVVRIHIDRGSYPPAKCHSRPVTGLEAIAAGPSLRPSEIRGQLVPCVQGNQLDCPRASGWCALSPRAEGTAVEISLIGRLVHDDPLSDPRTPRASAHSPPAPRQRNARLARLARGAGHQMLRAQIARAAACGRILSRISFRISESEPI